jgi:hypothetical protein
MITILSKNIVGFDFNPIVVPKTWGTDFNNK